MGDKSKIEWTDASWTPIRARYYELEDSSERIGWHCEHVSEGCRNCYAESMNKRLGTGLEYKPGNRDQAELLLDEEMLLAPLKWRKPRKIFVCSMTDLFGDWVKDEWIDRMFAVMALCPQHTFQVLTKRPARMKKYATKVDVAARMAMACSTIQQVGKNVMIATATWPLPNLWLGTSCEDQAAADERIPDLLATPAAVRFVSAEPLLGPIDLERLGTIETLLCAMPDVVAYHERDVRPNSISGMQIEVIGKAGQATIYYQTPNHMGGFSIRFPRPFPRLDWVIVGGESGQNTRPMHPEWAQSLRDQCAGAGVPFFFKQWGEYLPVRQNLSGCGKILGATAVKPGRMKLHYFGIPKQAPKYAFAERGVAFASTVDGLLTFRVGKKAAGRLLDGIEHNGMPEPRA